MLTLHTNLKNNAPSQLTGHDFNSYCKFGDHYLACATGGVFEFDGDTYDGVNIDAYVKTFVNKLGYDANKRLRFIYLGIETDGTLIVTPTVDGADKTAVTFTPTTTGRQYMRMPIGRGSEGAYWSFKIENVDGCWFAIDEAHVLPIYLPRWR